MERFKNILLVVNSQIKNPAALICAFSLAKNNNAQLNYGTGKDVNEENIKDAEVPLKIIFSGNSSISLPVWYSLKE